MEDRLILMTLLTSTLLIVIYSVICIVVNMYDETMFTSINAWDKRKRWSGEEWWNVKQSLNIEWIFG